MRSLSELAENNIIDEYESKRLLAENDIEVPRGYMIDPETLHTPAVRFPCVLKVIGGGILHKSDVGAVILNIRGENELRESVGRLKNAFPGRKLLVEEMISGGLEAILGVSANPDFGLVMMLGVGGIFAELYHDVSFRLLPVSGEDAHEMISETSLSRFVGGFRGIKIDQEALIRTILALSNFVTGHSGEIMEFDLNPLLLTPGHAVALDAKIVLAGSEK